MEEFFHKLGILIINLNKISIALYAVVYLTVFKFSESKKLSNFLGGITYTVALYFGFRYILWPALQ